MKSKKPKIREYEIRMSISDFLKSYNQNMPAAFPRATLPLLHSFQETHAAIFKHGDLWSLDQHRKKLMDWLPRNSGIIKNHEKTAKETQK